MKTQIFESIKDVPAAEWDAAGNPDEPAYLHAVLTAVETAQIPDYKFHYVLVSDGSKTVACAVLNRVPFSPTMYMQGRANEAIRGVQRFVPSFLTATSIECGSPILQAPPISFAPDVDRVAAAKAVSDAIETVAKREKAAFVMLHRVPEEDEEEAGRLFPGHAILPAPPEATLRCRWRSFDEYLAAMTKRYRHEAKKRLKTAAAAGVTTELTDDYGALAPDFHRLYLNVRERARGLTRTVLPEEYFRTMAKHARHCTRALVLRRHGEVVAYFLYVLGKTTMGVNCVGLDYRISEECALYYTLLYNTVRYAIDEKLSTVRIGLTTLFPKMSVGADPDRGRLLLRFRNPVLNTVLPPLYPRLVDVAVPDRLHVFRDQQRSQA